MINKMKPIRFYLVLAVLGLGYYTYTLAYGKAFWESGVTRNTEYNKGTRVRGVHGFYHK